MKTFSLSVLVLFFLSACSREGGNTETRLDSAGVEEVKEEARGDKKYSNARFRNVTVEKAGANRFVVSGQGQIFEANFGWVVEDGHRELKSGFEMTDAGAPAWGNFEFVIQVKKQRPNSTLTMILYESSAKDGSRQHELAVPLP